MLWGPYIRGHMAMNRVDTRMPLDAYLDAVHAIMASVPPEAGERLKKINDQLIVVTAAADPERARRDWGLRPEHRVTKPLEQMGPPPA